MAARFPQPYPPRSSEKQSISLLDDIKDWQLNNGSLMKLVQTDQGHTVLSRPIGVSVFPTPFPEGLFCEAQDLQLVFNELYTAVACDEEWLQSTLRDLITVDHFTATLWNIHLAVKECKYVQAISVGHFRSDYMIHQNDPDVSSSQKLHLKQVEFNSYSCAGASHAQKVTHMQNSFASAGLFDLSDISERRIDAAHVPVSNTVRDLAGALLDADLAYGGPRVAQQTCLLFLVQPRNFNVCDERPVEYAMRELSPDYPVKRITLAEMAEHTILTERRELLYIDAPGRAPLEVSVVYMRAGYEEAEYDDVGIEARLRIEKSRAIKCPSILAHLTTSKKVQQALSNPGVLERFVSRAAAERIRSTFMPIYPLDDSEAGRRGRLLATNAESAQNFILKPSREGGGHNLYGQDIHEFLALLPERLWPSYILMEKINPPILANLLNTPSQLYEGSVVSELGIFGLCMWRSHASLGLQRGCDVISNQSAGFTFKTKPAHVDEMSVVKGFGCFDTPYMINDEAFRIHCTGGS